MASVWMTESSVLCKLSTGVSSEKSVSVTVGNLGRNVGGGGDLYRAGNVGTATKAFTFNPPISISSVMRGNVPTTGAVSLSIFGSGYGSLDYTQRGRVGGTPSEVSRWLSESSLTCLSPALAPRPSAEVVASAGNSWATVSRVFSSDRLIATSLFICNGPTTGAISLSLSGRDFGRFEATPRGSVGVWVSEATVWVSDSMAKLRLPAGTGVGASVRLDSRGQLIAGVELSMAFTFDLGPVTAISPLNGPSAGGFSVTLAGSGFGSRDPGGSSVRDT